MQPQFPPEHPLTIAHTQVVLPDGAFIRALPFAVDEIQRFRIDALVVSADILASAYIQMIDLALRSSWEEAQSGEASLRHIEVAMFQQAWSMVDQIYSLRLLLKSLDFAGEDIDAFMAATECAYILRNRMDHLDARIPNIAASKNQPRSLFGSLSYFVIGVAVGTPDVDVFIVNRQIEPLRPPEQIGSVLMPAEIRLPIGNFVLSVADQRLDLDSAIMTLGPVIIRTNQRFEKSIRDQVTEKASEHGIDESALLAHSGAGYKIMLALKIDQPPADINVAEAIHAKSLMP